MFQRKIRFLINAVFVSAVIAGVAGQAVAQCVPEYYQQTFKKVYRQNKMFLEGVADLNGDGRPDAYGYELDANTGTYKNLVILPNDTNGGFGDPIISSTTAAVSTVTGEINGRFYGAVSPGKIDNDADLDLIVRTNTVPAALISFENDGAGNFTQKGLTTIEDKEIVHQVADFNNDGIGDLLTVQYHPDLVRINPILRNLSLRIGNSDGTYGTRILLHNIPCEVSPAVGDFNNDQLPDISFVYYFCQSQGGDNKRYLKTLTNQGGGIFAESNPLEVSDWLSSAANIDGDQDQDLIGDFDRVFMNETNGFSSKTLPNTPAPSFDVNTFYRETENTPVDLNGDGNLDILFEDEFRLQLGRPLRRYFSAFINDGNGDFTRINYNRPFNGLAANIDADPEAEQIVFVNSRHQFPLHNAANLTIVSVHNPDCQTGPVRQNKFLLDFGGDGISDIAMWNPETGKWRYLSNVEEGSFTWGLGSLGDIPAPGDFDGDGKTDPAVYREPTGAWYILRSSDGNSFAMQFGLSEDIPVPADYDGDGTWEIAVYRPSEGIWYLWNLVTQQFSAVSFGISEDIPVPQDYDGDGKLDIAVFRPSTGAWYYLKSTDQKFAVFQWGSAGDRPVPADYDADGKADLAVFRPADNIWYIRKSFDGQPSYYQFGIDNAPMAIDSNGDGSLELGFYFPPSAAWYASGQTTLWAGGNNPGLWGFYGEPGAVSLRVLLPNGN